MGRSFVRWGAVVVAVVLVGFAGLRLWAASAGPPDGVASAVPDLPECDAPNCVSSEPATPAEQRVAPLDCDDASVTAAVAGLARASRISQGLVTADETEDGELVRFLHVEVRSRWLAFADDVVVRGPEDGPFEVFSGSRLGSDDLGVNAERVEAIRSACTATGP